MTTENDTAPDTQRQPCTSLVQKPFPPGTVVHGTVLPPDPVAEAEELIRDRAMLLYRDPGKSRMWSAGIDRDLPRLRKEALAMCERMAQHLQAITYAAHALPEDSD